MFSSTLRAWPSMSCGATTAPSGPEGDLAGDEDVLVGLGAHPLGDRAGGT